MLHSQILPTLLGEPGIKGKKVLRQALNFDKPLPDWLFTTDSRKIIANSWFVALQGNNFDGHNFAITAIQQGAAGLIISEITDEIKALTVPILLVENTLEAYQNIALYKRRAAKFVTVAITGSNGKTTTKEMLKLVLSQKFKIEATLGNENNEIGVPMTILRATEKTEILIAEFGMRGLGQIEELVNIAEPDYVIVTNIGTAHIGLLGSRENIAQAKAEIFINLTKGKIALIPFNEPLLDTWIAKVENNISFYKFGDFQEAAFNDGKITFKYLNEKYYLKSPNIALVFNACAVIQLALILGLSHEQIQAGLSQFEPQVGRGEILNSTSGATIIDETYNASPDSVLALASSLAQLGKSKKKVLVLGEMAELGDFKGQLLNNLASNLESLVDEIILIGEGNIELAKQISEKAVWISSPNEAFEFFIKNKNTLLHKEVVLGFKASRIVRLEKLIEKLVNL
jgi:UDP-N-acetylmuramoyl-tripeptide--D-alanyl-D-alanine ligase